MINRRDLLIRSAIFSAGWVGALSFPVIKNLTIPTQSSTPKAGLLDELKKIVLEYSGIQSLDKIPHADLIKIENLLINKFNQEDLLELESIEERLLYLIKEDFLSDKTTQIEGWVLSNTEFELLAYKKLIHIKTGVGFIKVRKSSYETAKYSDFLSIKAWGPKNTCVGDPFNQQLDGHSSNWFSVTGYVGPLEIYFGERRVKATFKSATATTKIDGELFDELTRKVGKHDIIMYNPVDNVKQKVGEFIIASTEGRAKTVSGHDSKTFGEIISWGPKSTKKLTAFNIQKDGSSVFWIKTSCPPIDTKVFFDGFELPVEIRNGLITAKLKDLSSMKSIGKKQIVLSSGSGSEEVLVGQFEIKE
jgi:hypothetical protein